MTDPDHEAAAAALEATGRYRVLRRLEPWPSAITAMGQDLDRVARRYGIRRLGLPTEDHLILSLPLESDADLRAKIAEAETHITLYRGIIVDCETTGLDFRTDEVIELAMLSFTFTSDGAIVEVGHAFDGLRQPSRPIPAQITAITGICDADVVGKTFGAGEVAAFAGGASLVVAHNAAFDRSFVERFCSSQQLDAPITAEVTPFPRLPWACSIADIDWAAEGSSSARLEWLLMRCGLFYDAHRALADCRAVLELLSRPLRDGRPALVQLLENARTPTHRVWAIGAPFEAKDRLKARGYRWNGGEDGRPPAKTWYCDVRGRAPDAEMAWLATERICRSPRVERFTAFERYREGF